MIDNGWPYVLLNINYRTHSGLCLHTSSLTYNNQVMAQRQVLGIFGTNLIHSFREVYLIDANGKETIMTSYAHFPDVSNSTCQTSESGSSSSEEELNMIAALTQLVVSTRVCRHDQIMHTSGYRSMCKNVRKAAAHGNWGVGTCERRPLVLSGVHNVPGARRPPYPSYAPRLSTHMWKLRELCYRRRLLDAQQRTPCTFAFQSKLRWK